MAYSNDKVWPGTSHEALDIVNRALRIVGEYDEGDAATTAEKTSAELALNSMIREWAATDGVGLWLRKRCILILNRGKQRYSLGPTGTPGTVDDFHFFYDTELIENSILTDEVALQTTISIDDDTWVDYAGNSIAKTVLADADVIGIRQDDLTIHWTTVATAAAGADVVDITTGLISAASAGNKIYTYTTRAPRPHGIVYSYRESTSRSSTAVDMIGRREYESLSMKNSTGVPTQAHFDPGLHETTSASNSSTLHVWPVKNPESYDKLVMVCEFHPDIITSTATDEVQFPDEWASCLAWSLASELALEYEVNPRLAMMIDQKAKEKYNNLTWAADREEASFFMSLETHGRY